MSIEYADSIWPVTKLIPRKYNYSANTVFRSVHYYNGNSFLISLIKLIGEPFDPVVKQLCFFGELAFGHRFVLSHLDRMRSVGDMASAEAVPTELGSRTLGNPRFSRTTWAIAK